MSVECREAPSAGEPEPASNLFRIDIANNYAAYVRGQGRNFFRNIAKATRRLGEVGTAEFQHFSEADLARGAVDRLFELGMRSEKESSSDKSLGATGAVLLVISLAIGPVVAARQR